MESACTLCSNINCTAIRRVDVHVTLVTVRLDIYRIFLMRYVCRLVERDLAFKN